MKNTAQIVRYFLLYKKHNNNTETGDRKGRPYYDVTSKTLYNAQKYVGVDAHIDPFPK